MRIALLPELQSHAMPTADDRALAIAVERVVRPLPFSHGYKARIRDDLFSHLKSIQEEESARGGTFDEIVARSLARFGDSNSLSSELRAGVNWRQALAGRLSQIFDYRTFDSAEQFCLRFLLYVAAMMAVVLLVVWPAKWLLGGTVQQLEVVLSVFAVAWVALFVTGTLYFGIKFADAFLSRHQRKALTFGLKTGPIRFKVVINVSPLISMAGWILLLANWYTIAYFASNYVHEEWYLLRQPDWGYLTLAAMGTTLVGLAAGFGFLLDRRYRQSWETLPIFPKESTA